MQLLKIAKRWGSSVSARYDLLCIGGGSGGLACAREAAKLGKSVAILDYVQPSQAGSTWGLGGTCVNVGCIPKKLMHHAAILGQEIQDARAYGWNTSPNAQLDWSSLVDNVQNYVRSMNFSYRAALMDEGIKYYNAKGVLESRNIIVATDKKGRETRIHAQDIVLALGGRPKYPEIPGASEYGISSDDIFSLDKPPGKTLIVGGSYIALETAGFLSKFGFPTTVMARSILLRGFDRDMAQRVGTYMESHGTTFLHGCEPISIEKTHNDSFLVRWADTCESMASDTFDTVLFATGRQPSTRHVGLEKAGITYNRATGKVVTDLASDATNVPNIFAIGDIVEGGVELTPVAIRAGQLLAQRLYGQSTQTMDYRNIPTVVFTPLEYASVGLTEEEAIQKIGSDNVQVYHTAYNTLEMRGALRKNVVTGLPESPQCYTKAICDNSGKVLGLHLCGPNAGEIIQGFAVAIRLSATINDFRMTVGVHPTQSEEIVSLSISKASGDTFEKSSC